MRSISHRKSLTNNAKNFVGEAENVFGRAMPPVTPRGNGPALTSTIRYGISACIRTQFITITSDPHPCFRKKVKNMFAAAVSLKAVAFLGRNDQQTKPELSTFGRNRRKIKKFSKNWSRS